MCIGHVRNQGSPRRDRAYMLDRDAHVPYLDFFTYVFEKVNSMQSCRLDQAEKFLSDGEMEEGGANINVTGKTPNKAAGASIALRSLTV